MSSRLRAITIFCVLVLLAAACGGDDSPATTVADDPAPTTTAAAAAEETTTVAPETTTTTTVPPTTTTEPAFEPPASIVLDDGTLSMEPSDTSYRATLEFSLTATLSDGSTQMASTNGDGGKLIAGDGSVTHSFVVDVEGPADLPDCLDLAALDPAFVSLYDTFYGGDGGDLTGEAMLAEAGITNNGVEVDRYAVTLENIKPEVAGDYVTFSEAYIDIARDGGYVVSVVLSGTGFNNTFLIDQTEPRDIIFDLDFSEFGTFTEFVVPEGCQP